MDTSPGYGMSIQCLWRESLIPPPLVQRSHVSPACSVTCLCAVLPVTNAFQGQHLAEFGQWSSAGVVERANTMGSKDWRGVTGSPGWLQGGGKGGEPLVMLWPMSCWAMQPLPLTPVDVTAHNKVTCSRHASSSVNSRGKYPVSSFKIDNHSVFSCLSSLQLFHLLLQKLLKIWKCYLFYLVNRGANLKRSQDFLCVLFAQFTHLKRWCIAVEHLSEEWFIWHWNILKWDIYTHMKYIEICHEI